MLDTSDSENQINMMHVELRKLANPPVHPPYDPYPSAFDFAVLPDDPRTRTAATHSC